MHNGQNRDLTLRNYVENKIWELSEDNSLDVLVNEWR